MVGKRRHVFGIHIFINPNDAVQAIPVSCRGEQHLAIVDQSKLYIFVGKRHLRKKVDDQAAFRAVAFHKFESGRRIIEQICNEDGGAVRTASRFFGDHLAAMENETRSCLCLRAFGDKLTSCHCADRSQRLPAKAQRFNGIQILCGLDFAGRVAQKRRFNLICRNAAAVIGHADIGLAAMLDFHDNRGSTGVKRVFHQFLDDGDRTLNHLTRRDFVGDRFI